MIILQAIIRFIGLVVIAWLLSALIIIEVELITILMRGKILDILISDRVVLLTPVILPFIMYLDIRREERKM
jgi:hypothetical protein